MRPARGVAAVEGVVDGAKEVHRRSRGHIRAPVFKLLIIFQFGLKNVADHFLGGQKQAADVHPQQERNSGLQPCVVEVALEGQSILLNPAGQRAQPAVPILRIGIVVKFIPEGSQLLTYVLMVSVDELLVEVDSFRFLHAAHVQQVDHGLLKRR